MKRSHPASAPYKAGAGQLWLMDMHAPPRAGAAHIQGRHQEIGHLRECIGEAAQGNRRVLLVSGAPGVGKTALLGELRRLVGARNGRFVECECTADSCNQPGGALRVLRALGQLLLTEPDEELAVLRRQIVTSFGSQAGVLCAVVPEFQLLLGDIVAGHAPSSPGAMEGGEEMLLRLLQVVASPRRLLVVLLENLHLCDVPTLDLFDQVMTNAGLSGLVLAGSFRDDQITAAHPLSAALGRWSAISHPLRYIHLENLRTPQVARMLAQMLPMGARDATALAQTLMAGAGGNPRKIIELVNSMRQDGLLMPVVRAWRWNADAVRGYLASHEAQPSAPMRAGQATAAAECPSSNAPDELDTLAVLRASQALGSERNTARLCERVQQVLGEVTGASRVVLWLWDDDANDWVAQEQAPAQRSEDMPLHAATQHLPMSALRYAERTREPLLLADALADHRFSQDPYFQSMEQCSLMVVPVVHHGSSRAVLVLENRKLRAAFSASRLHAAMMIGGQLAVSLESAQLYQKLERTVHEQTRQLREAHSRLVDEARRAGMAQIATNVLHNVGNVLTSVNVSTHVLATRVRQSRSARVADLAQLLESNAHDIGTFFETDEKGRLLPGYVRELAQALEGERDELLGELTRLGSSVDHITNVVAMQQSYAGPSGVLEPATMSELVDDALRLQEDSLARDEVQVVKEYACVRKAPLDKTRVMQILVNLIENARQAMEHTVGGRTLRVSVDEQPSTLRVQVEDTGCGIDASHLTRIFSHGFTTKQGGHGFGLHSCAVAAREMGGSLQVHSAGAGQGATFTLYIRLKDGASD